MKWPVADSRESLFPVRLIEVGDGKQDRRVVMSRMPSEARMKSRSSLLQCFTLNPVGEHAREGKAHEGSEECCSEHDAR